MSRTTAWMSVAAALVLEGCSSAAPALPPGSLDPDFATPAGYVLYRPAAAVGTRGVELAVQPDGKIVVAGRWIGATSDDLLVLRFTAAGRLDTTFGTGGAFLYGGTASLADTALGLALQADGKIVVTGYANVTAGGRRDLLVLRVTADGALDPTFGTGGVFTYNGAGSGTDIGFAVRVQADGRIVVAGESGTGTSQDAIVLRLTAAGALDPGFANQGVFVYAGAGTPLDRFFDVQVLPGGGLLVAGTTGASALAVKLTSTGALDASFGTGGAAVLQVPSGLPTLGYAACLQPDGKAVLTGVVGAAGAYAMFATRIQPAGTVDTAFGAAGWFTHAGPSAGDDVAYACAVQGDGSILLAGSSDSGAVTSAAVVRLTGAGALDAGFGTGGVVLHDAGTSSDTIADGMALQGDGKILLAGSTLQPAGETLLVMRIVQ